MPLVLAETITQGNSGSGVAASISYAAPVPAGNLLVLVVGWRGTVYNEAAAQTLAGWTRFGHNRALAADARSAAVYAKVAAGGEQAIAMPRNAATVLPASATLARFTGWVGPLAGVDGAGGDITASQFGTLPAITPTAPGSPGLIVRVDHKKAATPNPGPLTLAGYTLLGDSLFAAAGNRHRLTSWWVEAPALAATYAALARSASGTNDDGVVLTTVPYGIPAGGFPRRFW